MCSLRGNIHGSEKNKENSKKHLTYQTEHGILYKYVRKQSRVPLSPQRILFSGLGLYCTEKADI